LKADDKDRYQKMLEEITNSFARFAALLDRDYIFAWLDWDGDNVLADAGIIDYGSVRQFGLRHDQYRYDDIQRFSTNLNEQCQKTRDIVQTFVQMVDFLRTGKKRPWKTFATSPWLKHFDKQFRFHCLKRFLFQMGFPKHLIRICLHQHRRDVEKLFSTHSYLERLKTFRKVRKVADGVHRPAILNMRVPLAMIPAYFDQLPFEHLPLVEAKEFFGWILSESNAGARDRKLKTRLENKIMRWQKHYLSLLRKVTTPYTWDKTLAVLKKRAAQINHGSRITGNALIHVVDEILRHRRRGLSDREIQMAIEELIVSQTLNPDFLASDVEKTKSNQKMRPIVSGFLSVVHGYREDI
jgi:hypothetical protein